MLWGHGYVARYFDGEPGPLWLKRWRCPACGAVYTMRPHTHWRRFLAPWWLIMASLVQYLERGRSLSLCGRQRQRYWFRGLLEQRQAAGGLGEPWQLYERRLIVATHSLTDNVLPRDDSPINRSFAATAALPGG